MAYATLSQLRSVLTFEAGNTADDVLLTALLGRAQAVVEQRTGRWFEAISATRYYTPGRDTVGRTLYLDADLLTVTTLTNGDGTEIATASYVLQPANVTPKRQITLKFSSGYFWTYSDDPEGAISVAGTWGYSATAPEDIVQATLRLAAYLYRQKDAQVFDVTAQPEQGVITIPQGIPRDVRLILDAYREWL